MLVYFLSIGVLLSSQSDGHRTGGVAFFFNEFFGSTGASSVLCSDERRKGGVAFWVFESVDKVSFQLRLPSSVSE